MKIVINENKRGKFLAGAKNPLRLTALLYLKESLLQEKYEDCGEIIFYAKQFGASDAEIVGLLEDVRRKP